MNRNFLPVSIDITNEKILVLGGDQNALKKILILLRFGALVDVVSRKVNEEIKLLGVKFQIKHYEPSDLEGYLMVYSCLNNVEIDRQIQLDAKTYGTLVNIHDNPEYCQFISPAVFQHRYMTVAVASNGQNVYNSIKLRDHLSSYLNENIQKIIDL